MQRWWSLGRLKGKGRVRNDDETTIFFATDVHGSDVCFKKFVNAARFYGADVLLLGGDLTGKVVAPILDLGGERYRADLFGKEQELASQELADYQRQLADMGYYYKVVQREELDDLRGDPERVDGLFHELMRERLNAWTDYAEERLRGSDIRIITMPGNDDPRALDEFIRERDSEFLQFCEGDIVEVAPGHQMINTGYTNRTPWNTYREYSEAEISARLGSLVDGLDDVSSAIFNIHPPPHDCQLDTAPMVGDDLKVRTAMGTPMTGPAGSTAVRESLEAHQPLLSLHGHIHESGGRVALGRTTVINAGSEYGEGVLRGVLVTVGGGRVHRVQITTG